MENKTPNIFQLNNNNGLPIKSVADIFNVNEPHFLVAFEGQSSLGDSSNPIIVSSEFYKYIEDHISGTTDLPFDPNANFDFLAKTTFVDFNFKKSNILKFTNSGKTISIDFSDTLLKQATNYSFDKIYQLLKMDTTTVFALGGIQSTDNLTKINLDKVTFIDNSGRQIKFSISNIASGITTLDLNELLRIPAIITELNSLQANVDDKIKNLNRVRIYLKDVDYRLGLFTSRLGVVDNKISATTTKIASGLHTISAYITDLQNQPSVDPSKVPSIISTLAILKQKDTQIGLDFSALKTAITNYNTGSETKLTDIATKVASLDRTESAESIKLGGIITKDGVQDSNLHALDLKFTAFEGTDTSTKTEITNAQSAIRTVPDLVTIIGIQSGKLTTIKNQLSALKSNKFSQTVNYTLTGNDDIDNLVVDSDTTRIVNTNSSPTKGIKITTTSISTSRTVEIDLTKIDTSGLDSRVSHNADIISSVQGTITVTKSKETSQDTEIADLKVKIDSAKGTLKDLGSEFKAMSAALTALANDIANIKTVQGASGIKTLVATQEMIERVINGLASNVLPMNSRIRILENVASNSATYIQQAGKFSDKRSERNWDWSANSHFQLKTYEVMKFYDDKIPFEDVDMYQQIMGYTPKISDGDYISRLNILLNKIKELDGMMVKNPPPYPGGYYQYDYYIHGGQQPQYIVGMMLDIILYRLPFTDILDFYNWCDKKGLSTPFNTDWRKFDGLEHGYYWYDSVAILAIYVYIIGISMDNSGSIYYYYNKYPQYSIKYKDGTFGIKIPADILPTDLKIGRIPIDTLFKWLTEFNEDNVPNYDYGTVFNANTPLNAYLWIWNPNSNDAVTSTQPYILRSIGNITSRDPNKNTTDFFFATYVITTQMDNWVFNVRPTLIHNNGFSVISNKVSKDFIPIIRNTTIDAISNFTLPANNAKISKFEIDNYQNFLICADYISLKYPNFSQTDIKLLHNIFFQPLLTICHWIEIFFEYNSYLKDINDFIVWMSNVDPSKNENMWKVGGVYDSSKLEQLDAYISTIPTKKHFIELFHPQLTEKWVYNGFFKITDVRWADIHKIAYSVSTDYKIYTRELMIGWAEFRDLTTETGNGNKLTRLIDYPLYYPTEPLPPAEVALVYSQVTTVYAVTTVDKNSFFVYRDETDKTQLDVWYVVNYRRAYKVGCFNNKTGAYKWYKLTSTAPSVP